MKKIVLTLLLPLMVAPCSAEKSVEKGRTFNGDINGGAETVYIRGTMNGNVFSDTGAIYVISGATVKGNIQTVSGNITVETGAAVSGNITQKSEKREKDGFKLFGLKIDRGQPCRGRSSTLSGIKTFLWDRTNSKNCADV